MIYVLTSDEMRAADAQACAASSDVALMRNAGERIAEYVRGVLPNGGRIVAFAGPGNNGGDAFAACAALDARYTCTIYAAANDAPSAARADALEAARASGATIAALPETDDAAHGALAGADLALDGLFGTGARLPIAAEYRAAARALDSRALQVVAIDIPSGIDANTGEASDDGVRATATIALAALKPGHLFDPSRDRCGDVWLAQIGIGDDVLARHAATFTTLDDASFLAKLPRRTENADKRSAGAPLIFAGSQQFPGAAVLCARAAARAGAGYVTVATSAAAAPALRTHLVEQVVVELRDDVSAEHVVDELADVAQRNSSLAIGPGLGLDARTGEIVRGAIARIDLPIVLDASALFHLAKHLDVLEGKRIVLTPHDGEFARLSGEGTIAPGQRVERLRRFVDRAHAVTLLKGRATLVNGGETTYVNPTGTSALATAGTGDVLTGITATLLSQGLSPFDAATVAAYWHGRAGREAARERRVGVIAGDLPEVLARALPMQPTPAPLRCVLPA